MTHLIWAHQLRNDVKMRYTAFAAQLLDLIQMNYQYNLIRSLTSKETEGDSVPLVSMGMMSLLHIFIFLSHLKPLAM